MISRSTQLEKETYDRTIIACKKFEKQRQLRISQLHFKFFKACFFKFKLASKGMKSKLSITTAY